MQTCLQEVRELCKISILRLLQGVLYKFYTVLDSSIKGSTRVLQRSLLAAFSWRLFKPISGVGSCLHCTTKRPGCVLAHALKQPAL